MRISDGSSDVCASDLLILGEVEPAVELPLRLADGRLDARNTVLDQGNVTAFGHEGDLVLEVGQPVVDRRCRQHQHLGFHARLDDALHQRSEEHTSELQSLMRISYAVFCLKKKKQ